ncbi:hypothetical protein PGUG_04779 [Meyerozyma guilliermondii ATCC 6260]|uniref:Heat shock transcription factor n=1 Tax=Meyerozyma guilliermondii (strain ATCC 6260 / CBS 566 / DSM 6381 / JCM 1539 / NBRC 10279 / NRRL Y-324) TaxID=294746 RepID=A5DNC8_PICGU|nr:uncharacterized protein PGUG_04779 [Meyerozyma guilliermondii ATCC 6260]EDK40681.2 hypothetical protein PGUG_04779 [Meyerozyma guilliermondii ATCC 6260]
MSHSFGSGSSSVITPREGNNSTPSTTAGKTQTVFIHKLYDMLSDPDLSHLIWWAPSNESFYLLPTEEFSKVLALYFKHTNIASFIRQLNMYGFHKVNDAFQNDDTSTDSNSNSTNTTHNSPQESSRWEFKHSAGHFRKGDVDSLRLIKRRSSRNVNSPKEVVNIKSIPTSVPASITQDRDHDDFPQSPSTPSASKQLPQVVESARTTTGGPTLAPPAPHTQAQPQGSASANMVVELNNNLNSLRSDCFALAARVDAVVTDSRESHMEMLQVVELLQRLVSTQDFLVKEKSAEKTDKKVVSPVTSPEAATAAATAAALADLRTRLHNRLQQPLLQPMAPAAPQSRNSSNPNIVPQQYPLNPYFSIYSQDRVFRFNSATEQPHERNMSFMDPLQRPQELDPRLRVESKSNSPLSASGPPAVHTTSPSSSRLPQPKQQIIASSPQPSHGMSSGRTSLSERIDRNRSVSPAQVPKNYQQYPFPIMTPNPSAHLPVRRTSSMPTIDPPTPDVHTSYFPRRSLTDSGVVSDDPPRSLPTYSQTSLPTVSTANTTPSELPQHHHNNPQQKSLLLPSVSELDKSLKSGGSYSLMNLLASPSYNNKRRVGDDHEGADKRFRP